MHLFLCVAAAAFLVGGGARANSARALSAARSAKRHLKSHESPDNAEERVSPTDEFDLVERVVRKYFPIEVPAGANAWTLPHELDASASKENKYDNLKELLYGWTTSHDSTASGLDFSSARIREWVKTNGNDAPDVLFKMLGILNEVKKQMPNRLLVSFNVKRWFSSMEGVGDVDPKEIYARIISSKHDGMYKFRHRITKSQVGKARPELDWLVRGKKPEEVFKNLEFDHNLNRDEISKWIEYVDAFNNVYPAKAIPFLTALDKQFPGDESTVKAALHNAFPVYMQETDATKKAKEELKNFCYSRALPPATVRNLVGLSPNKRETGYDFRRFAFLSGYVKYWNEEYHFSPIKEVHLMETMKETYTFKQLRTLRDKGPSNEKLRITLLNWIAKASKKAGESAPRGPVPKNKQRIDVAGTSAPRGRPNKKQNTGDAREH